MFEIEILPLRNNYMWILTCRKDHCLVMNYSHSVRGIDGRRRLRLLSIPTLNTKQTMGNKRGGPGHSYPVPIQSKLILSLSPFPRHIHAHSCRTDSLPLKLSGSKARHLACNLHLIFILHVVIVITLSLHC